MDWQPIETATKSDYVEILVAVTCHDVDELTHRFAMWDPENGDWTVFSANWDAEPVYWMPLPPLPPWPADFKRRTMRERLIDRLSED